MNRFFTLLVSICFIAVTGFTFAQDVTSAPSAPTGMRPGTHPRIAEIHTRMKDQWVRIKEGEKSGKLTSEQAKALKDVLKSVQTQMKADFQQNNKRELTDAQLAQLNQLLDDNSKSIYGEKHDGASTPAADSSNSSPDAGSNTPNNPPPSGNNTTPSK